MSNTRINNFNVYNNFIYDFGSNKIVFRKQYM